MKVIEICAIHENHIPLVEKGTIQLNEDKASRNLISCSFHLKCDMEFLLFAELCIVGAASQDSFGDIFDRVETVKGLDDQPERELNNVQIAAVVDGILRRISGGDQHMHQAIIDSLLDMLESG